MADLRQVSQAVTIKSIFALATQHGWRNPKTTPSERNDLGGRKPAQPARPVKLVSVEQMVTRPAITWLVPKLLPAVSLVSAFGLPSSGKTFLVSHLCACIVRGDRFLGRRVKRGKVLYVCAEGNMRNRAKAILSQFECKPSDMSGLAFLEGHVNMRDVQSVEQVIAAAREHHSDDEPIRLIVLDTLNRTFGAGDENSGADMGSYVDGMARLREEFQCAVLAIHHAGKDIERGGRGHSSLLGNIDVEMMVKENADGTRTAELKKGRDSATGEEIHFKLKVVDLGPSEDPEADPGEREDSCIVVPADAPAPAQPKTKKLSGAPSVALAALRHLAESGEKLPATSTIPGGVAGVRLPDWKRQFLVQYGEKSDATVAAQRKAFSRAKDELLKENLIGISDPWVWVARWATDRQGQP